MNEKPEKNGKDYEILQTNLQPFFWQKVKNIIRQNKKAALQEFLFGSTEAVEPTSSAFSPAFQDMEDKIQSYARLAGLKASCKNKARSGEQECSRHWWFRNDVNELQSKIKGLGDHEALTWVKEEWEYRDSLIDSIYVRYDLADYLPKGIKLEENTVHEIQCAIQDNVNWAVTDDSKLIDNDIREYVRELIGDRYASTA